eukprot:m.66667 g.66667  ORF g.66667 m.66667 type:complete len:193 (+) comp13601_c0_seq1:538-1116(+)
MMNFFDEGNNDPFRENQPRSVGSPKTPKVEKRVSAKYYGFALCKDGDNNKMLSYSTRSLEAILQTNTKPGKVSVTVTSEQISIQTTAGDEVACIPICELRSFARHQTDKSGKPKMITLMALNRFNDDARKAYQCFMLLLPTTAEADAFCQAISMAFAYSAEYKRLLEEKRSHDAKLTQLPGSPRLVRVGWAN